MKDWRTDSIAKWTGFDSHRHASEIANIIRYAWNTKDSIFLSAIY